MLAKIDKVLAPLCWIAAGVLVLMLFVGPAVVANDKGSAATKVPAGTSPYAKTTTTAAPAAASAGKKLFIDNCGTCHTLAKAGTTGTTGPDLGQVKPDAATVLAITKSGAGVMPSFAGTLSDAQRAAIAAYVAGG